MLSKKGLAALFVLLLVLVATPAQAGQEDAAQTSHQMWIALSTAFGMAIASAGCGMGQGMAVSAACQGISRNPSAGGQIRGALIIGLVLIESLAIYTLLIGLVLIFLRWTPA